MLLPACAITSATDNQPVPRPIEWPHGFNDFREADGSPVPGVKAPNKDGEAWTPATFNGPRRKVNVVSVHALVLDYDTGTLSAAEAMAHWPGYERVLHSTYTPGRWRIIIPYARPHTAAEHAAVYEWALTVAGAHVDASCSNPDRLFYWPTCRSDLDIEPTFLYAAGQMLDVSSVTDFQNPPVVSSQVREHGVDRGVAETAYDQSSPYAVFDAPTQREDLGLIESRCAFMRHARENATELPEPEWYAALSVISRCKGGDDLAHEVSRPHPNYSDGETTAKYERAKAVGPATCAHIRAISRAPKACEGCPLTVTSPVTLGRNIRAEVAADPHAALTDAEARLTESRVREDAAIVAVTMARRYLAVIQSDKNVSETEILEATSRHTAALADRRLSEAARRAREKDVAKIKKAASVEGVPAGADPTVWSRLTVSNATGRATDTLANCMSVLRDDPRWSSRLTFDEFAVDVRLDGVIMPEESVTDLAVRMAEDYTLDTTSAKVAECVRSIARQRPVHPVRDWLRSLPWDGTPRVRDLLLLGFGALPLDDEALVRTIGEKFIVSLVARAMHPGSQVDTMLVLVGKQGSYKSTSLATLVGDKWFSGSKLDLMSKDSFLNLRGKWLYEVAEMDSVRRVEQSASKQWLTQRIDTYRAPYDKRSADHPRQTVMAGTTNEDEFLMDPSGHRRYWPMRVTKADLGWIRANREQLFAEALVLYSAGTSWWVDEGTELSDRLEAWSAPFQAVHPWSQAVAAWLQQTAVRGTFTSVDVLNHALMVDTKDLNHADVVTVNGLLKGLKCERLGRSSSGGLVMSVFAYPKVMVERAQQESQKKNIVAR